MDLITVRSQLRLNNKVEIKFYIPQSKTAKERSAEKIHKRHLYFAKSVTYPQNNK